MCVFEQELLPLKDLKSGKHGFCSITEVLMKFIWYLTINKIQVEFENEDYASIWAGVMAHD